MTVKIHVSDYLKWKLFKHSIKRYRLDEQIQKQDPYICCLQETYLKSRDTYRLKMRGWKKILLANGNESWSSNTHIRQNRL